MKLKDITRLSIRELDDAELAKLHSQLHGMDKSQDEDRKKREREIWEKHNFVAAELITRNQKHTSALGNDDGDSPASSNTDTDGAEPAGDVEDVDAGSGSTKGGLDGASDIEPISKPYPNEHACRIKAPGGFDRIRRKNNAFGKGIHAIYGVKDNKATVQALRFDKKKFTAKEAKAWAKDHDYTCKPFEAASEKADTYKCECLECGHTMTIKEHCKDTKCPECGGEMRRAERPGAGKDARIRMGKSFFLLSEMNSVLQEAFGDSAWCAEIDLDGPAVITSVWVDGDYTMWRVPFELTESGLELKVGDKTEVEQKVVYTTKQANVTITAPVIKESMDNEKRYALYVVYVPEMDDSQGERMTKEDIEKACWSFGRQCYFAQGNRIDMQHAEDVEKHGECMVVENFVSREEGWMGKTEGTWFIGIIHGEDEWEMLKNGDINGVSMAGQAVREERETEDD